MSTQQPRVLVVEDEESLHALLQYNLEKEGFSVDVAVDGEEALMMIDERAPDIVILDWMLPKVSGIEVCRRLRGRAQTRNLPIIMLTARGEESDRVRGLDTGADDYMVKPFSFQELLARLEAIVRRARPAVGAGAAAHRLTVANLELDPLSRQVRRGGQLLDLKPQEFRLLEFLMRHAGQVVTRTMILESVWDYHFDPQTNVIDVHVSRLRAKIDRDQPQALIHTVRGAGYCLREPEPVTV